MNVRAAARRLLPSRSGSSLRALVAAAVLGVTVVAGPDDGPRDADGFLQAHAGHVPALPRDHRSHPETRTEWWYLTGPLLAEDGRRFGFQATWFRRALVADAPAAGRSPLAVRDVLLFHGAVTDVDAGRLHLTERASRGYAPWAGASEERLDVHLLGNVFAAEDDQATRARLEMTAGEASLRLELDLAACAPLLHGEDPGLSVKGPAEGQASWYYSLPRIPLTGTLRLPDGERLEVTGTAWFDHEYGSSQLGAGQVGWDWFSVPLDDGSDLMLYTMRLADGRADATSAGTFRGPDSGARHLSHTDYEIVPQDSWTSPHSGARYPSGWTLRVPGEELELTVVPLVDDQEIRTPRSTGVTYWEGLCAFRGTRRGQPVEGHGYVELVGYAGAFEERL